MQTPGDRVPRRSATGTLLRIGRLVGESRLTLIGALAAVVILGLAQLYLTWLVKEWVEGPLLTGDRAALLALSSKVTATIVVTAFALFLSRYLVELANQRLVERLRNEAVARLLTLEVPGVRRFSRGDVIARLLNDAGQLSGVLSVVLRGVGRDAVVYVGAVVMMAVLDWRLTLASALLVPALLWLMVHGSRRIRQWRARAQADVGRLGGTLTEQLQGFTTIKGYQTEAYERQRFADRNAQVREQLMRSEAWFSLLASSILIVTGVGMLAVLAYATILREQGEGYSRLLAFCLYGVQLIQPLRRFGDVQGLAQRAIVSADRVLEIVDAPGSAPYDGAAGQALVRPVRGRLAFDAVCFAYEPQTRILSELTFTIEPGERVGLVGVTGSGKSTVANLLLRHLHPSSGTIRLDGHDIGQLRLRDLRGAVAVVEQEPFLFSGALLDNLRYGTWGASEEAVERAVHMSGLERLVPRLPHGLQSCLAEAGVEFSGGEKQRIALARAIVKDAPVLVLDEATSAIDSELEAEIFGRLDDWLRQRTVIVIGHRYSTVRRCPRIVVLEGGRVVGDGSAPDLLRGCPRFAALFADQIDSVDTAVTMTASAGLRTVD